MLGHIDTGIIFAYLALMIAIGIYASRRQNSVEDFFVAGGKLGSFSIACLWLASWVGGAAIVGGVTKTHEFGISGGWYITCMAVGCLLFGTLFAARIKRKGNEHQLLTYSDFIETGYDSRTRIYDVWQRTSCIAGLLFKNPGARIATGLDANVQTLSRPNQGEWAHQ